MTKRILTVIFSLVIAAGSAMADIVNVDFSGLGTTIDITLGGIPGSLILSGVTFQYDPQGSNDETASAASSGIFGFAADPLIGKLNLDFATPAVGLLFTYSLGNDVLAVFSPTGTLGDASGTFRYGSLAIPGTSVSPFSSASLFFDFATPGSSFAIDSMQYDTVVPEPGAFSLMACCLLGLCGRGLMRRRS